VREPIASTRRSSGGSPAAGVEKADAGLVRSATGCSIGAAPRFGHATRVAVYRDRDRLRRGVVWAAAGRPEGVLAITPRRLVELSAAEMADPG
jgi:prolyl-tRNA editing enzyme YbaK/EbsC (Cys-tRNA(Pro) deacylase)